MADELRIVQFRPRAGEASEGLTDPQLPRPTVVLMLVAVVLFAAFALMPPKRRKQFIAAVDSSFAMFLAWTKVSRLRGRADSAAVASGLSQAHTWWTRMRPFFRSAKLTLTDEDLT